MIWILFYFILFQNLVNLSQFFPWKILCLSRNNIFQVKIWPNFTHKKQKYSFPWSSFAFQFWKTWEAASSAWGFHANGKQLDLANLKMQSLNQSRDALIQLRINLKFSNCKSGVLKFVVNRSNCEMHFS